MTARVKIEDKGRATTFYVDVPTYERVSREAKKRKTSVSAVLRYLISLGLDVVKGGVK